MANLIQWDPFNERSRFGALSESMEDWMNRFMRPRFVMGKAPQLDISIDVKEIENGYEIKADIPGVKKEDITVSIDGNMISIGAEVKKETTEKKGEKVLHEERYYGKMSRSFTLPSEVDQSKSEAKYTDGVLEMKLVKRPGSESRKLQVN